MAKLIIDLGPGGSAEVEHPDGTRTPIDIPVDPGEDKTGMNEDVTEGGGLDDLGAESGESAAEEAAESSAEEDEENAAGTEVPPGHGGSPLFKKKNPSLAVAIGIGKPKPGLGNLRPKPRYSF